MSKTINYLFIFVCGVAAGALGAQSYFEKKYKAIADDEIHSVKEVYGRRQKTSETDISEETEKTEESEERILESVPPKDRTIPDYGYSGAFEDGDPTDYRKFYSKKENTGIEVRLAEKEAPKEDDFPYLITEDEFSETELSFDKVSCTFYVPDRVLVDDLSREVIEPYAYGEDNVEYLVQTIEKVVYIRNEKLGCDMEISRDLNSIEENGDTVWYGQ